MSDLSGQPGELRMTIQIKRAATGHTETHDMVGRVVNDVEGKDDGSDALDASAQRGD